MKKEQKIYLNTDECAELINRSPEAVRNLVLRHKIPYRKPSGRLVFLRNEIIKWMEGSWNDFEIESGIAIPSDKYCKYPFREMKPGDSFFVPLNGEDPLRLLLRIKSASRYYKKKMMKFTIKYIRQQSGIRCWRSDDMPRTDCVLK